MSWQSGAKEYHHITNHTQEIYRERYKRVAASAVVKSNRELNGRQAYEGFLEAEFSRVDIFRVGIGRISSPE